MTDFLNDWGLTLVTFVPLAGALVMMAVPAAEEQGSSSNWPCCRRCWRW